MIPTHIRRTLFGVSLSSLSLIVVAPEAISLPAKIQMINLSEGDKAILLKGHNQYRSKVNTPNLEWSSTLEHDARQWAAYLAGIGGKQLIHAHDSILKGQGENLWMEPAERFSYEAMVQTWAKERKHFRPGIFPNVSKTGDWSSVGHYTQVIWGSTRKLGCAQARAGGNDLLVCRYDPKGNVTGQNVF